MKPYFTSRDLIEAVKRNMAFPIAQVTFQEQDILNFANEEMYLSQVPSILEYHSEYLVFSENIPLKRGVIRYDIPERAIGVKLRDLAYVDVQGNMYEMTDVGADHKSYYNTISGNVAANTHFYLEGNEIVLTSDPGDTTGYLFATYYLRPNALVLDERAAIATYFTKTITVNNLLVVAGDKVKIGDIELEAGVDFAIGVSSNATAANLNVAINNSNFPSTVSSNILQVRYELLNTTLSSTSAGFIIQQSQGIEFDNVPSNITNGAYIDFLQTKAGHKTYKIDVRLGQNAISSNIINFPASDVPEKFKIGDYICLAYECIIPQIPSDLHILLSERTTARVLSSIGDQAGLQTANQRIQGLEQGQATLIDNRVEGSPRKVFNRHSLLRYGKRSGSSI
jgi:hypothetical protein